MASDCSQEQLIQELTEVRTQLAAKEKRCRELSEELSLLKAKKQPGRERLVRSAAGKLTKQAEEALRESEAKYRNLFENMTEEVHFWQIVRDEAGRIKTWRLVDVNPPTLKTWGRSTAEEIRGKTTDEIFGPGGTDHYMPVVQKIMTEGVPYSFEDYFPNLDKYFRFTSVPLGDYFITTGADITDIKKAYEALRESEERWAVTLSSIGDAVIASDTNGRVSFMNPVAEKLTGWSLAEAAGRPVQEVFRIVNEHTRVVVDDPVSKVLQTGLIVGLANHTVLLRKGGGEIPIDDSGAPIRDTEGRVFGVVLIFRDITERKQAGEALRAAEETARQRLMEIEDLYHNAPVGLCVLDRDLRWVRINERLAEINGIPAEAHIGKRVRDLMPELAATVEPEMRRVLETGQPRLNIEIVSETPAQPGIKRIWLEQWLPLTDADGRVTGLSIVVEEITDRKRAEKALRDSEEQFRVLTHNLVSAVALINERGEISIVNKSFLRLFDLAEDADILNINSRDWGQWQVFDEAGRLLDLDEHPVRKAARTRTAVRDVLVAMQCPGRTDRKWVLISTEPILDAQGNFHQLICTYHDITARRQVEEALRESEARFRLALKNSPVLVAMQDSNLVYQWAYNTRTRRPEDVVGKTDADLFAPEDMPSILEAKRRVIQTDEVVRHEHWLTSNGQRVFLDCYYEPVRDSAGKIIGVGIAAVNLTEQKQAEEALRESEERLRLLGDNLPDSAVYQYVHEPDGSVRFVNFSAGIERLNGVRVEDVLSEPGALHRQIPQEYIERLVEAEARSKRELSDFDMELPMCRPDGQVRWMRLHSRPRRMPDGRTIWDGVQTDITERKRAEEELRLAYARLQTFFDHRIGGIGIVIANAKGDILQANDYYLSILGCARDELLSGQVDWRRMTPPEWLPADERALQQLQERGVCDTYEKEYVRRDGSRVPVLITDAMMPGDTADILAFVLDITARKQAEEALWQLNQTLEQRVSERTELAEGRARQLHALAMELIEAEERERRRLADLLHDDLQQSLAAARMQLQGACECLPPNPVLTNVEQILSESLKKARRLSHELSPAVLHHSGLVASLEWLAGQMKEQFGLHVQLESDGAQQFERMPLKVFLFRAVQELLFNVVKHAGVKTAQVALSSSNGCLAVSVTDQGQGFDPRILDSITSLGGFGLLSLRERANYIGGSFDIESALGKGSRFTLTVPARLAKAEKIDPPATDLHDAISAEPTLPADASGIRVLFVDDHHIMRKGLMRLMSGQPVIHVVGEASNGQEAIEQVRQLKPDVVMMDVSMPVMDGIEATRRIKVEWPEVRVIGLSMYDDENTSQKMRDAGADIFMSKTASPAELLKAIYGIAPIRTSLPLSKW